MVFQKVCCNKQKIKLKNLWLSSSLYSMHEYVAGKDYWRDQCIKYFLISLRLKHHQFYLFLYGLYFCLLFGLSVGLA